MSVNCVTPASQTACSSTRHGRHIHHISQKRWYVARRKQAWYRIGAHCAGITRNRYHGITVGKGLKVKVEGLTPAYQAFHTRQNHRGNRVVVRERQAGSPPYRVDMVGWQHGTGIHQRRESECPTFIMVVQKRRAGFRQQCALILHEGQVIPVTTQQSKPRENNSQQKVLRDNKYKRACGEGTA
jgi:hypothetical protein